ncbi:hypothetical protein HOH45_09570 [bacterium]|jgi:hypothetical protein|nr:hypothetical protein [bacterium]
MGLGFGGLSSIGAESGLAGISGSAGLSGITSANQDRATEFSSVFETMMQSMSSGESGLGGSYLSPSLMKMADVNAKSSVHSGPRTIPDVLKQFLGQDIKLESGEFSGVAKEIVLSNDGYFVNVMNAESEEMKRVKVKFSANEDAKDTGMTAASKLGQSVRLEQAKFMNQIMNSTNKEYDALESKSKVDLGQYMNMAKMQQSEQMGAVDITYYLGNQPIKGKIAGIKGGAIYLSDGTPLDISFEVTS